MKKSNYIFFGFVDEIKKKWREFLAIYTLSIVLIGWFSILFFSKNKLFLVLPLVQFIIFFLVGCFLVVKLIFLLKDKRRGIKHPTLFLLHLGLIVFLVGVILISFIALPVAFLGGF